jgi:hypothetical protein
VTHDASLAGDGMAGSPLGVALGGVNFKHWESNGCLGGPLPGMPGQLPKWNGSVWVCADDIDTNSGGTITGVTAGSGLTGGGTLGTVTVAASYAGSGGDLGSAAFLAHSDHVHDALYYTKSTLNTAGTINTATNPVDWTKLKGVPAGLADGIDANSGGTVTSVTAGTGLTGGTITGSGRLPLTRRHLPRSRTSP